MLTYYSSIIPNSFRYLLFSKLCQHNWSRPKHSMAKVANQFLQWQGSLYWGRNSIVAVLHKGCIAYIAHRWLSQGLTLHHPLKPCHSCNFGNKSNCKKSFFAVCTYHGICQNFELWENTFNGAIILELDILHIRMFHSFRSMNETPVVGWTKDTCISKWNEVLLSLHVPLHMKFPFLGWFNLANLLSSSPWPKLTSHPNKTKMNILIFVSQTIS